MLERFIDQIGNMRLGKLDLPVGKGFLFVFFDGLMTALGVSLGRLAGGKVPSSAVYTAMALAAKKIGPVKRFFGESGAELAAFVNLANAIDDLPKIADYRASSVTWTIQQKLQKLLSPGVSGPGMASPSLASPEMASPEMASPEFSAPVAGEELLNSVERKLRAIKQAETA